MSGKPDHFFCFLQSEVLKIQKLVYLFSQLKIIS